MRLGQERNFLARYCIRIDRRHTIWSPSSSARETPFGCARSPRIGRPSTPAPAGAFQLHISGSLRENTEDGRCPVRLRTLAARWFRLASARARLSVATACADASLLAVFSSARIFTFSTFAWQATKRRSQIATPLINAVSVE
jgi:hypothetical protein